MTPEQNPFLQIEDPFSNIKNKRDDASKAQLEFMHLCWQMFHVEPQGIRLMQLMQERYFMRPLFSPDHPQCKELALYWEGFKEAIRGFYNMGLQHQQYINGVLNNGRQPNTPTSST